MRRAQALYRTYHNNPSSEHDGRDSRPESPVALRWKAPEDMTTKGSGGSTGSLTPRRARSASSRGSRQSPERQRRRSPTAESRAGQTYGLRRVGDSVQKPRMGATSMIRTNSPQRDVTKGASGVGGSTSSLAKAEHPLRRAPNSSSAHCMWAEGGAPDSVREATLQHEFIALQQDMTALSVRLSTTERERNWAMDALKATEAELQASFSERHSKKQQPSHGGKAHEQRFAAPRAEAAAPSTLPEDPEVHLHHYRVLVEMLSTRCRLLEQWLEEEATDAALRESDARLALQALEEQTTRLGASMVEQQRAFKARIEELQLQNSQLQSPNQSWQQFQPAEQNHLPWTDPHASEQSHTQPGVLAGYSAACGSSLGTAQHGLEPILESPRDAWGTLLNDQEGICLDQSSSFLPEPPYAPRAISSAEASAAAIAAAAQLSCEINDEDGDDRPDDMAALAAPRGGHSESIHLSDSWDSVEPVIHERSRGIVRNLPTSTASSTVQIDDAALVVECSAPSTIVDFGAPDWRSAMASDIVVRASPQAVARESPYSSPAHLSATAVAAAGAACARATAAAAAAGMLEPPPGPQSAMSTESSTEPRWHAHASTPGLLCAGLPRSASSEAGFGAVTDQPGPLPAPRLHSPPPPARSSAAAVAPASITSWDQESRGRPSSSSSAPVTGGDCLPPSPQFGNSSSRSEIVSVQIAPWSSPSLDGVPEELKTIVNHATEPVQASKAWTRIGQWQQRQKSFIEARAAYDMARHLDASQHGCIANLAQLEAHAGNLTDAYDLIQQAMALEPTSSSYASFAKWLQAACANTAIKQDRADY